MVEIIFTCYWQDCNNVKVALNFVRKMHGYFNQSKVLSIRWTFSYEQNLL